MQASILFAGNRDIRYINALIIQILKLLKSRQPLKEVFTLRLYNIDLCKVNLS